MNYEQFITKHRAGEGWQHDSHFSYSDFTREKLEKAQEEVYEFADKANIFYTGPLEENQNDSPSVGQFFEFEDFHKKHSLKMLYSGYMIGRPRNDVRVSVDGVTLITSDPVIIFDFLSMYPDSSSKDFWQDNDENYCAHFWWD